MDTLKKIITIIIYFVCGIIVIPLTALALSFGVDYIYGLLGLWESIKRDPLIIGTVLSFVLWFVLLLMYKRRNKDVAASSKIIVFILGGVGGLMIALGITFYVIRNLSLF